MADSKAEEAESESKLAEYLFKDRDKPVKVETPEDAKKKGFIQTVVIFGLLVIAIIALWWVLTTYFEITLPF